MILLNRAISIPFSGVSVTLPFTLAINTFFLCFGMLVTLVRLVTGSNYSELVPILIETRDCDNRKCSGTDKEAIQNAWNSINNGYGLPVFLENEEEGRSDGVKEVEPVDFKVNSCGWENNHE